MKIDSKQLEEELNDLIKIKHFTTYQWANTKINIEYDFSYHHDVFNYIKTISEQVYEDMWENATLERLEYLKDTFKSIKGFLEEEMANSECIPGLNIPIIKDMEKLNESVSSIHRTAVLGTIDDIVEILSPINQEFVNHIIHLQNINKEL